MSDFKGDMILELSDKSGDAVFTEEMADYLNDYLEIFGFRISSYGEKRRFEKHIFRAHFSRLAEDLTDKLFEEDEK